jgi:hypothetical protein
MTAKDARRLSGEYNYSEMANEWNAILDKIQSAIHEGYYYTFFIFESKDFEKNLKALEERGFKLEKQTHLCTPHHYRISWE